MKLEELQDFELKPSFSYDEDFSQRDSFPHLQTEEELFDVISDPRTDDWFADLSRDIADDDEEQYELADEGLDEEERQMSRKHSKFVSHQVV